MRYVLSIILMATAAFAEKTGDFAPTSTGSVWEYSYVFITSYVTQLVCTDSLSIRIELVSKTISGTDTLIVLTTRERGRSLRWADDNGIKLAAVIDTTVDTQYNDTVAVSADSIYRRRGYRCKVFPFWKAHVVDADSVSRGISSVGDSLKYIALIYGQITLASNFKNYADNAMYLQNTGLTSSLQNYFGNHNVYINIKLLSYNGNLIPTGIRQSANSVPQLFYVAPGSKVKTVLVLQRATNGAFTLAGRSARAGGGGRMAPGLVVLKVKRSLKVP